MDYAEQNYESARNNVYLAQHELHLNFSDYIFSTSNFLLLLELRKGVTKRKISALWQR